MSILFPVKLLELAYFHPGAHTCPSEGLSCKLRGRLRKVESGGVTLAQSPEKFGIFILRMVH